MQVTAFSFLCFVAGCFTLTVSAQAQPTKRCNDLMQAVYALTKVSDMTDPEITESIRVTAREARTCYERTSPDKTEQIVWILNKEVWALAQQGRSSEVETLVDQFFDKYSDGTSDYYRANMGVARMHTRILSGEVKRAKLAYDAALPHLGALRPGLRAGVHLNLASFYAETDSFNAAFQVARRVESDLRSSIQHDSTLRQPYGRALVRIGDMITELANAGIGSMATRLDSAAEMIEQAVILFREDRTFSHLCFGLATLGMLHVVRGDKARGLTYLDEAIANARLHKLSHQEIASTRERGRAYMRLKLYGHAEQDFRETLRLSRATGISRYELRTHLDLAHSQEAQGHLKQSRSSYQHIMDKASLRDVYEARRIWEAAKDGLLRVGDAIERRHLAWIYFLAALVLLSLAANAYFFRWRRRHLHSKVVPHEVILSADDEDTALFKRRLSYIYRVVFEPVEVAALITDPLLAKRLQQGHIKVNAHIFACAAALEEAEEGKTFENRPANTYASYLKPRFERKGWTWPLGMETWQAFLKDLP